MEKNNRLTNAGAQSDVYTDLSGLQKLRRMSTGEGEERQQAMEAVAKQFESLFINMMMKSMRDANEAFTDDSLGNSNDMKFYQQMYDQQLSLSLSERGIGLSDALIRQMGGEVSPPPSRSIQALENPFSASYQADFPKVDEEPLAYIDTPQMAERQAMLEGLNVLSEETFETPAEFVAAVRPAAEVAARELGVNPDVLISQAALETGWGRYMIRHDDGSNSYNLFGIKADSSWQGDVAVVGTMEFVDGVAVPDRAGFRSYSSFEDSFTDYVQFLKGGSRYADALASGARSEDFVRQLQKAGYATDPGYADKILAIMESLPGDVRSGSGE